MNALPYQIIPYQPCYQPDFFRINAAWIEPHFGLEPEDIAFLNHPETEIIAKGGAVYLAQTRPEQGEPEIIGTGGLFKLDEDTYELIRLAVDERYRGHGVGKALTAHALPLARSMGATRVILESSLHPVNARAVAMYEAMGFRHHTPRDEHRSALTRAGVWMVYEPLPA